MKSLLTALATALTLAGCGLVPQSVSGYGAAPVSAETVRPYRDIIAVLQEPVPISGDCTPGAVNCTRTALVTPRCLHLTGPDTGNVCKAERNNAMAALMIGSENACLLHRKSIYGNEAGYNIALGTATSLFAGAASVVTQAHDKAILAALATFANSERSLINETVYKTMIVSAVDKKIQELRDTQAQAIHARLQTGVEQYGLQQALYDWSQFHSACSFMTGLQRALDEGVQGGNAQKMLRLRANLRQLNAEVATGGCAAVTSGTTSATTGAAAASAPGQDCASLSARQKKLNEELMALETQ